MSMTIQRVNLETARRNPIRDFTVDPVSPEALRNVTKSVKDDGFWRGGVCGEDDEGIFIIAGETRRQAALKNGIKFAELLVHKTPDPEQILRIYANENAMQRGIDSTSQAGSVAAAVKIWVRKQGRGSTNLKEKERQDISQGVGEPALLKLLSNVPGITENSIRDQLANLKASGDLYRILKEEGAALGGDEGAEVSAVADKDAARPKSKMKTTETRIFDLQGVQRVLKKPEHVHTFRKIVTGEALANLLPVDKQADLAKHIAEEAKDNDRELTGSFLRERTSGVLLDHKSLMRRTAAEDRAELESKSWTDKAERHMDDFAKHIRTALTAMQALSEHCKDRPKSVSLYRTGQFNTALETVEKLTTLGKKLP